MKYEEYLKRTYLDDLEVLALSHQTLIEDIDFDTPMLPAPPMLMFDRVTEVQRNGSRGKIVAEKKIRVDDWFFQCHFRGDPVMPGCLGVDAIWQLTGLFAGMNGARGSGRALGCGEVEFSGQIRPHDSIMRIEVTIRKYSYLQSQKSSLVVSDGNLFIDDDLVYVVKNARVGVFENLRYKNYPNKTENSKGGLINRSTE